MAERIRLGVLATHPIQYHAPLFRDLADSAEVDLTVYFEHRPTPEEQGEEFGIPFQWDIPLTGGYRHVWMRPEDATDGAAVGTPREAMRRREFDAFLVMGWHARSYRDAMRAGWRYRVPLLVRGDSHLGNDPAPRRLAKRLLYPLFVRRFAVCLSVGSRSEEYFRYYCARRIVRAPHYVDNALFAHLAEELRPERDTIRAEWGIAPDAVVFLFAGKLIPRKRPQDFIEALASVADRRAVGLIVGEGSLRQECEALARGVPERIRFAGFLNQSQMPRAYAAADVLVLPSSIDTWGLVVNEAMASGRPAIVSRAVGCEPDMIRAGVSGFSHDTGDARALGELMARVTGDAAERERLSLGARQVVSEFTVEAARAGVVEGARRAMSAGGGR